ncbi:MAG: hypothetical protein ACRYFX_06795 [Janthinobacterium lividum]
MSSPIGSLRAQYLLRPIQRMRRNVWLDALGKAVVLLPILGGLLHLHDPQANRVVGLLAGLVAGLGYYYYCLLRALRELQRTVTTPASGSAQLLLPIRRLLRRYYLAQVGLLAVGIGLAGTVLAHRYRVTLVSWAGLEGVALVAVGLAASRWLLRGYWHLTFQQHLNRLQSLVAAPPDEVLPASPKQAGIKGPSLLMRMKRGLLIASLPFALQGIVGQPAQAQAGLPCTVFVVGGNGRGPAPQLAQTLAAVRAQAAPLGASSTLVLLDERLGPTLLSGKAQRTSAQLSLLQQLHDFPGRLVVVPGGTDQARDAQLAQLLATPAGRPGAFVPDGHCPGPVEILLDGQHTLVVLNTAWWLQPLVPGTLAEPTGCEAQDPAAVLTLLQDILRRNQGRHLLLVGQHSLALAHWQLPLLPNPGYQLLQRSLRGVLEQYPGLTYVSGQGRRHARYDEEHALHYVSSGPAAPHAHAAEVLAVSPGAAFGGFTRLEYGAQGQVRASYWVPDAQHPTGQAVVAERQWVEPGFVLPVVPDTLAASPPPAAPTTVVVAASTHYGAGRFRRWLQGANYRREWAQPVRVQVLNLATAQGGLTPIKRGGGLQTKALRLRSPSGEEFVLRSVEKDTDGSVPDFLHHTLAASIVQDQISAAHPYAALLVPPLAEAAGVGHTSPQLVLVPDEARLGIYRHEFAGTLALLEARDPTPPRAFTGQPIAKHFSTADVLTQLQASTRHRVDQRAVLRARLLDMILADWDRHDDQWRWLAYPRAGGGYTFRPLPRDRDQALFVNEGFLPRRARAAYLLPRIQGFDADFQNVNTFNYNARYFDRSFLTELSRADWRALADSVQASLTDEVFAAGLRQWPDSIYRLSGPAVLAKLQAHRAHLPAWADQYYHFLARDVDVVGSDGPEEFEVTRPDAAHTQVRVYERGRAGQAGALRYARTFATAETREIRLYGRGGADVFAVRGEAFRGPVVRVVGGEGADTLRTTPGGARQRVKAYDVPAGLVLSTPDASAKLRLSDQPGVNQYRREAFEYALTMPVLPWGYNVDDGLFVGLGLLLKRQGFHKVPWASTQLLTANVALRTGAFSFGYEGNFAQLIGSFDLQLRAALQAPNYVRSFYGLGNETELVPGERTGAAFYRVRFRYLSLAALLRRPLGERGTIFGGPVYQGVDVEEQPGRILAHNPDPRLHPATLFAGKRYAGAHFGYELASRHARAELPQGVAGQVELLALRPLTASARPLTQLSASLAAYHSFQFPLRVTLATRFGGTVNFSDDYEFFQAATLGGLSNLRGFGRTRFAGRQSAYNNTEVRLQVAHFRSYLVPATLGILVFHDVGRVWVPGEASATWHRGYGPGLWLAPTPQVVLAALWGFSPEGQLPLVRLGFFF